jgi:hypothetical protein
MHPRLFETLILVDPVIQKTSSAKGNYVPVQASAFRRDLWPSREAAIASFKKNKFFQAWDPRVLECWIEHGLRELPTPIYPVSTPTPTTPFPATTTTEPTLTPAPPQPLPVTLKTTMHQEVFTFLRGNFPPAADAQWAPTRQTHPDLDARANPQTPFYRPEPIMTFYQLPHLRPSVLYIYGALSYISAPELRKDKLEVTGTGVGGSGGAKEGRVKAVVMEDVGHLIPMEKVGETADNVARWVAAEIDRWRVAEKLVEGVWEGRTGIDRAKLTPRFLELLGATRNETGLQKSKPTSEKL